MKTKSFVLSVAMFIAAMTMTEVAAFAEMIQGVVTSVDKSNNSLRLSWVNPAYGSSERLTIILPRDAKLKGIDSLDRLHKGSHVQVETYKIMRGIRGGGSVEVQNLKTL